MPVVGYTGKKNFRNKFMLNKAANKKINFLEMSFKITSYAIKSEFSIQQPYQCNSPTMRRKILAVQRRKVCANYADLGITSKAKRQFCKILCRTKCFNKKIKNHIVWYKLTDVTRT